MGPDEPTTPRQLLEELLDNGMVMVTVNARHEGVRVPPQYARDPQLRLNLSYRFGLPVELDDWGVTATLTFGGSPFECRLPWRSIYMMVSHVTGQPLLFPDNVPPELLQLASAARAAARAGEEEASAELDRASGPRLTLVDAREDHDASGEEPDARPGEPDGTADDPEPPRPPPRRGHLRVVK